MHFSFQYRLFLFTKLQNFVPFWMFMRPKVQFQGALLRDPLTLTDLTQTPIIGSVTPWILSAYLLGPFIRNPSHGL